MLAMSFDYLAPRPEKECHELPDPPNGQVHLTGRNFQVPILLSNVPSSNFPSLSFLNKPFPTIAEKVTVQLKNSLTNDFFI
jgi:hypothetical protein